MTIKVKPQGPRFKKFEIWTKMAKVPKPQGPKWQFTLLFLLALVFKICNHSYIVCLRQQSSFDHFNFSNCMPSSTILI
ncbi:hypothetical protein Hanom_Chr08g00690431 [Helianthus anomalus]